MNKIIQDSKLEYSMRDMELGYETGFEECKREVLEIIEKYNHTKAYRYIKEDVEDL